MSQEDLHFLSPIQFDSWLASPLDFPKVWTFVYLQWFFRCRAFQEVFTYQYISSEVRLDLFLELYEATYDTSIWYLHRSHTCAHGKNSPIVALHKAKSSQQFRLVHDPKNLQILHLMLTFICRLLLEYSA